MDDNGGNIVDDYDDDNGDDDGDDGENDGYGAVFVSAQEKSNSYIRS